MTSDSSTQVEGTAASAWNDKDSLSTLHTRAVELARSISVVGAQESVPLLVFVVRGRRFCVDLNEVRQVLPLLNLASVPQTPPWVAGIGYHDGVVIVLVDPSTFLGVSGPGISDRRHVIVLGAQAPEFGVLVDRCDEVQEVDRAKLVRLGSDSVDSVDAGVVIGVIPDVGEMVDVRALIHGLSTGLAQKPTA